MDSTTPPPPGPGRTSAEQQNGLDGFFDSVRRAGLVRTDDRWVAGVCGGLAQRLGVDAALVRGLVAVTVLFAGVGLVLYGLAWALLPEQRDGRVHLQELIGGNFDIAVLGAFAVFLAGLSVPGGRFPGLWWWDGPGGAWTGFWWLLALAVIAVLVVTSMRGRAPGQGPTTALPRHDPSSAPGTTSPGAAQHGPPAAPVPPHFDRGTTMSQAPAPEPPPARPGPTPTTYAPPPGGATPTTALPRQPRPRPGGPRTGVTTGVLAVGLLVLAGLMYADRIGAFTGPVLLTAGAVTVVLTGVAIVATGIRGRTSGALGGVAVIAILALLPVAAVERSPWTWQGTTTPVGELFHTPSTVVEAERGYSLGAGEARIDLTGLALPRGRTVEVPVNVGAGEVTIHLPRDGAYSARVQVFAGEIDWLGEQVVRRGGGGPARLFESQSVQEGAVPRIELQVVVGAGTVRVVEG
ncbi:PspC domain-containing protein [Cellulomonas bogoriensis]|uniref:Phage shock protein PspC N-terminal domain-containing protein n=1 Tax=Cellulomonas bogoriensis 69B4 = DSM 16987 TaxID=1386082 RepID=A0A0A0BYW2_9CELL|nr:PspC domain-containing protein [Cellulomonas bogoriensis]KGM13111.1 hypothetical protein N869_16175 [Cellulomonas bogoriensis 69B4 = DSM 16987]